MVENPFTKERGNKKVKAACNAAIAGGLIVLTFSGCQTLGEWLAGDPETVKATTTAVGGAIGGPVGATIGQVLGTLAGTILVAMGVVKGASKLRSPPSVG